MKRKYRHASNRYLIKNAKPKETEAKLADEKGINLLIKKSGAKYFRLDYRFAGKRKTLALGVYPETSLKEARDKRDKARKLISNNIDPLEAKNIITYYMQNKIIFPYNL